MLSKVRALFLLPAFVSLLFTAACVPVEDEQNLARLTGNVEETVTENASFIPILLYHALAPEAEELHLDNKMVVPAEEFEAQVAWLKERGYTTPTLAEFGQWLSGERHLPKKSILITFDDGYRSVLEYGFPVLKEHGFSAIVFIIGERPDGPTAGKRHLSWEDIKTMAESGLVEFQSHTYDGHGIISGSPEILEWKTSDFIEDLRKLEGRFHSHDLPLPWAFAYPFGAVSDWMPAVLEEQGYRLGFTTTHGLVHPGDDPLRLPRITVLPGVSPEEVEKLWGQ